MKKSFIFNLNDKEVSISLSIGELFKLPTCLQNELFIKGEYYVKSMVTEQNLFDVLQYMIDESKQLKPAIENACDYKDLCDEFEINSDFITSDKLKLSYLIKFKDENTKDKSKYEEYISQNLDYFLREKEDDMLKVPIFSLRNIFFHQKRILEDEEMAYQFIIKGADSSFYVLLSSLCYEKLSYKSRNESLEKVDERFGFIPKINYFALQEHENLFFKLYVANIKNRLNEISYPADEDRIRWAFELIQNAKDSLYILNNDSDPQTNKKVQITFDITRDLNDNLYKNVIFTHNGPPFSMNSYYGLIYKISEGKNKKKTTGKFGTGFLTTHVLSKTVNISGDRIEKNNEIKGFFITMIREGKENEEISNDIIKMQNTFVKFDQPFNLTKFEYPIKTEISSKCVELGLINFKKNIYNVLINCPDIEFVDLIENNVKTKYSINEITQIDEFISLYKISANNDIRNFIVVKNNKDGDISISIECSENMIVPKEKDQESLYTVFPLAGSSAHVLPFSINCDYFEPTTERNALILDGEEFIQGEITKVGTNRSILINSVQLFNKLICYLVANGFSNIYELTTGLIITQPPYSSFDIKWYNEKFLNELKDVFSSNVKVTNVNNEEILLRDAFIPQNEIKDEFISEFIPLSKRYYQNMISIKDCLIWRKLLWSTLHFVKIEDCIDMVQKDQSVVEDENLDFLNKFISFIFKYKKELLESYNLIPDMNNNFHCIKEIKKCTTVPDTVIKIMQDISIPWRSTHMSKKIQNIFGNEIQEDKINDAESIIIKTIKKNNSLGLNLMKYVLKDDKHREDMFFFVANLKIVDFKKVVVNDIDKSIWELADDFVLRKVVEIISSSGINQKFMIDFSLKFIPVFNDHFIRDDNFIKSSKVIPTANCHLNSLNNLFNKIEIFHNYLNPIIVEYFGVDFNNKIIHPKINQLIKSDKDENIVDMLDIINNKLANIPPKNQIVVAEHVLSFVPKNDNSQFLDQNLLFNYYQKLFKTNLEKIIIDDKLFSLKHWEPSNYIIYLEISKSIENLKTLDEFQRKYSLNEEEAFDILNFLYKKSFLVDNNQHPIVPNRYGEFKLKNNLTTNPGIDSEFYSLFSSLKSDVKIVQSIAHINVKINDLKIFNIQKFFQELSDVMDKVLNDENRDENKAEMINKFLRFDVNKFSNRSIKGMDNKMDLLINTHISFIHNRIREITSPSIFDYKRWPFELIQNAVDCFHDGNGQNMINNGTITFDFNDNNVTFTHNGCPFSNNNLISLLYQYGGGKEGTKSIGRFGTGFLSTLILSRTIHVSSDLFDNDTQEISGFEFTIDRNGENREELKKGIEHMEESKKMNLPIKGKTEFIFDLPSDFKEKSNGKAYEEGIESLKSNIPQSMIFNPLIKSIILKTKDETLTYSRINDKDEHIKTIEVQSSKKGIFQRSFIYVETNSLFEYKFTSKNITKNVHINCIVEIGENKNIICNEEFLYLSFPIFGDKPFTSPIIINSMDFEPQKERNDIIIQLDENRNDSYETAINKFIINKSFDAFRQIIDIALHRKCTDLYNFLSGIKENSKNKFFQENFVKKMRDMILEYPIFETQIKNEYKIFDKIYIPIIDDTEFLNKNDEENLQIYNQFYYLCSQIQLVSIHFVSPITFFAKNKNSEMHLVKYEHCLKLTKSNKSLWINTNSKLTINNFLKIISQYKNINQLQYLGNESKISFIREVIQFINKLNNVRNYLDFAFLINKQGDFVLKESLYYYNLSNEMINLLNDVDYDYTNSIIHDEIKDLCSCFNIKSFDTKKAIYTIKSRLNKNNCIRLMKYVTKNDDKRNKMHKFTLIFLNKNLLEIFIDIPPSFKLDFDELFQRADNIVNIQLIEHIQKIDIKSNIHDIHEYAKFLQKTKSIDEFKTIKIFPNQLYQLKKFNDLKKDSIKDEYVKEVIKNLTNWDIKEELSEDSFSDFCQYEYNFQTLSDFVLKSLKKKGRKFNTDDVIEISSVVIKYSAKTDDKSIKEIADLINFFYNKSIEVNKNDSNSNFSNSLVRKIMKMAVKEINNKVASFSNINEINLPQEELFKQLPILYYYTTLYDYSGKFNIFPNNSGKFMKFDRIQIIYDYQFGTNVLSQLIGYLNEFGSIINKDSLLHQSIQITSDLAQKIPQKIINMKSLVDQLLKIPLIEYYKNENPKTPKEKEQKTNAENFIKFIKSDKKLQVEFSDLIAKIDKTIPPEILEKQDHFSELVQIQRLLDQFEKQIQLRTIMEQNSSIDSSIKIHFIKAIVLDKINKFKGFNNSKCISMSNSQSSKSFVYNETTYFVDENDHEYDFSAEDSEKHNFYFIVKTVNGLQFNQKEALFQLRMMSSNANYFIIIMVNDSYDITIQWKGKM